MTKTLKSNLILLAGLLAMAIWASPGCKGNTEMSDDDQMQASIYGISRECNNVAPQSQSNIEDTADWPENWMVVHHEEWIPILDELGRRLHTARTEFLNGNQRATINNIRLGVAYLEAQITYSSERDRKALTAAITLLRAIMSRFNSGENVSLTQLEIAFANAYFSDLEREALVVEVGSDLPYLDQPDRHLQLAVERLATNDSEEAAREIERASAYLYLEGYRLGMSERAELNKAAQDLEHLAARLRILEIREPSELESIFESARQMWREYANSPIDISIMPTTPFGM